MEWVQVTSEQRWMHASIPGVIRLIFWMIVISYVFKWIMKYSVYRVVKESKEQMQYESKRQQQNQSSQQTSSKKGRRDDLGEYVDYIEIKD